MQGKIESILLVKTGSLADTSFVLDNLESLFPQADVYILAEEREYEPFLRHPGGDRVLFYINIRRFPALLRTVRQRQFDLKVILWTGDSSYHKLKLLAMMMTCRRTTIYTGDGHYFDWSLQNKKIILKHLSRRQQARSLLGLIASSKFFSMLWRLPGLIIFPFTFTFLLCFACRVYIRRTLNRRRLSKQG